MMANNDESYSLRESIDIINKLTNENIQLRQVIFENNADLGVHSFEKYKALKAENAKLTEDFVFQKQLLVDTLTANIRRDKEIDELDEIYKKKLEKVKNKFTQDKGTSTSMSHLQLINSSELPGCSKSFQNTTTTLKNTELKETSSLKDISIASQDILPTKVENSNLKTEESEITNSLNAVESMNSKATPLFANSNEEPLDALTQRMLSVKARSLKLKEDVLKSTSDPILVELLNPNRIENETSSNKSVPIASEDVLSRNIELKAKVLELKTILAKLETEKASLKHSIAVTDIQCRELQQKISQSTEQIKSCDFLIRCLMNTLKAQSALHKEKSAFAQPEGDVSNLNLNDMESSEMIDKKSEDPIRETQ